MKKNIISQRVLLVIALVAVMALIIYLTNEKRLTSPTALKEEIIDLSDVSPEELQKNSNKYSLLTYMTQTDTDNYLKNQSYYLDASTKVIIGTYAADKLGEKGGIIMLRPLTDGKFSIYWEITSPMFIGRPVPRKKLEDINNDGLKELITYWEGGLSFPREGTYHNEFWILTLDPNKKEFKVLNPIVDKNKAPAINFNFEQSIPLEGKYLNRFQTMAHFVKVLNMVRDIDNDQIAEVVLQAPILEGLDIVSTSPEMVGKGRGYYQIYKLENNGYHLWKEVPESSPEFKELLK